MVRVLVYKLPEPMELPRVLERNRVSEREREREKKKKKKKLVSGWSCLALSTSKNFSEVLLD